jgi:hypothetical protein
MGQTSTDTSVEHLDALVGQWAIEISHPSDPTAVITGRAVFEWLSGGHFLVERWNIAHPDFPDGIAVIGQSTQHYFDSRGVARVYEMSLADGVWKLWREPEPPDFSQRFTATFSEDGTVIAGCWEIAHDGSTYERDFDLTFRKVI